MLLLMVRSDSNDTDKRPATARKHSKSRAVLVAMSVVVSAVFSIAAFSSAAYADSCTTYSIDCTNPSVNWAGATKPCSYYATTVRSMSGSAFGSSISVELRFSAGGSGATCGTAWSRISNSNCNPQSTCDPSNTSNPFPFVQRTAPGSLSTYTLGKLGSGTGSFSFQVKDCCGGFQARAAGALFSTGGSTIVTAYTTTY
jgi:hypothetical protein